MVSTWCVWCVRQFHPLSAVLSLHRSNVWSTHNIFRVDCDYIDVQYQSDCGLFATAFPEALCNPIDPNMLTFNETAVL